MYEQETERVAQRLVTPFDIADLPCPVGNPVPEDAYASPIPEDLCWLLYVVVTERTSLHRQAIALTHFPYYTLGKLIMEAESRLLCELRSRTGLDADAIVEFHERWTYSVTTLSIEREKYKKKEKPRAEEEKPSGLCFAYKEQPPEVAHFDLWAYRKKT